MTKTPFISHIKKHFLFIALTCFISSFIFAGSVIITPSRAFADDICTVNADGTPTEQFKDTYIKPDPSATPPVKGNGIISNVVDKIKVQLMGTPATSTLPAVKGISQRLFEAITEPKIGGQSLLGTIRAAMTLYIAIYGILFMAGMVEIKFNDFVIQLTKLAIVGFLLGSSAWSFFNSTVVKFFNDGTDSIICHITYITVGDPANPNAASDICSAGSDVTHGAFDALDAALSKALSSNMIVTTLASFPTTVYGALFGLMLIMSLGLFMKSVLNATVIYVISLAMRTLLFGLAPIFIPCILFQRTKHLFDGWLNQVVSASITPVLLFVFLTFFVHLMDASMANILHTPVCWSNLPEGWRGSPFDFSYWRYMVDTSTDPAVHHWVASTGATSTDKPFPLDLVTILTFLILAYLANAFNDVVKQIAQELSGAATSLASGNPIADMMSKVSGGGKK
jgi:type IV secretory pathway VirB6-like protein